jgi:hypothetical protein
MGAKAWQERERCAGEIKRVVQGSGSAWISSPQVRRGCDLRGDPMVVRHIPRELRYRKQLAARFAAWCEITEVTRNPSFAF